VNSYVEESKGFQREKECLLVTTASRWIRGRCHNSQRGSRGITYEGGKGTCFFGGYLRKLGVRRSRGAQIQGCGGAWFAENIQKDEGRKGTIRY